MAWTAEVSAPIQQERFLLVNVTFTDGLHKISEVVQIDRHTSASFRGMIRGRLAQLTEAYLFADGIVPGPIDASEPIDPSEPPGPPSADDVARAAFRADWKVAQAQQRAIAAGFLDPTDKSVTDLQAKLRAAWDPSYVGMI